MQVLKRIIRACGALAIIAAAMMCGRVDASPITDSFSFDNTASDGSTVTGTFTYDTSDPSVVTDLTFTIEGTVFDSSTSLSPPTLTTFDGSELIGSFDLSGDAPPFFLVDVYGSFGPGPTGNLEADAYAFGEIPAGSVTVSGPITYGLNGSGGGGSSAPLPSGALGGLMGILAMGGISVMVRRRAATV